MTASKAKLLFVCVENSNRSQMSQAFAKILGGDAVEAYSAGSRPSGVVNPKAIAAMAELGYDLSAHASKSLEEVKENAPFDAVVTMGCGDACPWMPAKRTVNWHIPDPKHLVPEEFNKVRDTVRDHVQGLLAELGVQPEAAQDQSATEKEVVRHVATKAEFDEVLAEAGDRAVIVDFYAEWCGPCKTIAPHVHELALQHHPDVIFVKVNVEENEEVMEEAGVQSMPTFHVYKKAVKVADLVGANKEKLNQLVEAHK